MTTTGLPTPWSQSQEIHLTVVGLGWQRSAACTKPNIDPDIFFPERGCSSREARAVCARCPVAEQCLDYALTNGDEFGVWGGKRAPELRQLRKEQGRSLKKARRSHHQEPVLPSPTYGDSLSVPSDVSESVLPASDLRRVMFRISELVGSGDPHDLEIAASLLDDLGEEERRLLSAELLGVAS